MAEKSRKQKLMEMLAEDPNDAFLRYGLAMEFVSEGNDEEAVRQLQDLVQTCPDYVPGYQQAGQAFLRLGRLREAREMFTRGIEVARAQGERHAMEEMQGFLDSLPD
ncbi:MAG: hypothetical protein KatS3mg105_1475 [Gemmatales bacterium]|nr:MAG: hypothetical protein KatS3mg105_1475 [Gemmatales bacterium]